MTDTPTGPRSEHTFAGGAVRLGGRYEIGDLLGRGGMADVRVGRDLRLGRTVAIKRLRTDLASDPTFLARFRREAQSAAALNHPAIVAVYDTGEAGGADGDTAPYIVMEYVEGQTIREIMHDGRKLLPQRALELTAEILGALDYSHRAGIVHRDIKPGNVMLTPAGQVKVMDFGIARAIADASSAMTQTAAVVGTAQYLSPEQARGEQVDARSDIYSTGCLLFELLVGRPPFVGDSPVSVAYQHVREEPAVPSTINPEVTPAMDAIVGRALAKRAEDRYQSAADMRADIERAIAGRSVTMPVASAPAFAGEGSATQVGTFMIPTATAPAAAEPSADEDEPEQRRRRWPWVVAAIVLLLAIAGAGLALSGVFDPDAPTPPATTRVPDVRGESQAGAIKKLEAAKLVVVPADITRQASNDVDKGDVISTDPANNEPVEEGTNVSLVVSKGPEQVSVENVIGVPLDAAQDTLKNQGLKVKVERQESDAPTNQVIGTDPVAATTVDVGSTVTVTVSEGQTEVPDVVGFGERRATKTLQGAGFAVDPVSDPTATEKAGKVVRQSPAAGTPLNSGDTVTIVVSAKPEPPEPPEPSDLTDPTPPDPSDPEPPGQPTELPTPDGDDFGAGGDD